MVKLNHKIPATTLIETIVSMVIIMLVFGIAMLIFVNVIRTDNIVQRTEVFFKMNEILFETKQKKEFTNEIFIYESFEIRRTIKSYMRSNKTKQITVAAYNTKDELIAEKHELIIDTNEKD